MPIAIILFFIGVAAVAHWLFLVLVGPSGWDVTDSLNALMALLFAPTALAGLLLVVGSLMMPRWPGGGRIVATVGLGLAILFALYWGGTTLASLGTCRALPRGCGDEWIHISVSALGLLVAAGLAVAVWSWRRARPG